MTTVLTTTEEFPDLEGFLRRRHELGLDTYDEWHEGVYRTVTGPSPEHGRLILALGMFLGPLVEAAGLHQAAPVNIGLDKTDCRVPDLGVYRPDTPRTSPAFLERAELVVEILSPGERSGEKLPFYYAWAVREYLEIDLQQATVVLLRSGGGGRRDWMAANDSDVLGFRARTNRLLDADRVLDMRDFRP